MKFIGRFAGSLMVFVLGLSLLGCASSGPKFESDPLKEDAPAAQPMADASAGMGSAPKAVTPAYADAATNSQASLIPSASDLSAGLIHSGDELSVVFSDTTEPIQPFDVTVKEDGTITLLYNQTFVAAGRRFGDLQNDIRTGYVPKFFKYLTVSIKPLNRYFSVGGQVKAPSRQPYNGKITVLQAINTAGGFTDFASKTRVTLTRSNGKQLTVNCKRAVEHPELDLEVYPGDSIYVPKRF